MNDLSHKFETEYFEIVYSINLDSFGIWVGEILLKRKDTGQEVRGGFTKRNKDKKKVEADIYDQLESISFSLSKEPLNWNLKTTKILAQYLEFGKKITNFGLHLQNMTLHEINNELLIEDFFSHANEQTLNVISMIRDIENLTTDERKELLISPNEIYDDPTDPWNLDDITARDEILKFFLNPSPDEIELHEQHKKKVKEALDKIC